MPRSKAESKTDWERVKRENGTRIPHDPEDGPYDPDDDSAVDAYWDASAIIVRQPGQRGPQKEPTKERISIRLSHDVVESFRATGAGWQTRMDDALREWIQSSATKLGTSSMRPRARARSSSRTSE